MECFWGFFNFVDFFSFWVWWIMIGIGFYFFNSFLAISWDDGLRWERYAFVILIRNLWFCRLYVLYTTYYSLFVTGLFHFFFCKPYFMYQVLMVVVWKLILFLFFSYVVVVWWITQEKKNPNTLKWLWFGSKKLHENAKDDEIWEKSVMISL